MKTVTLAVLALLFSVVPRVHGTRVNRRGKMAGEQASAAEGLDYEPWNWSKPVATIRNLWKSGREAATTTIEPDEGPDEFEKIGKEEESALQQGAHLEESLDKKPTGLWNQLTGKVGSAVNKMKGGMDGMVKEWRDLLKNLKNETNSTNMNMSQVGEEQRAGPVQWKGTKWEHRYFGRNGLSCTEGLKACTTDDGCCSEKCEDSSKDGASGAEAAQVCAECDRSGASCDDSEECCSGKCEGNKCVGEASAKPKGSTVMAPVADPH